MSLSGTQLLQHTLAALAYRTAKALRDAPPGFESFEAGSGVRTPGQLLRHMSGLLVGAARHLNREQRTPLDELGFHDEQARFFDALAALNAAFAQQPLRDADALMLLQGPIADAITHAGQLVLLRRLAGAPVPGENFMRAELPGGVRPDQDA